MKSAMKTPRPQVAAPRRRRIRFPINSVFTPIILAGGMCLAAQCALAAAPATAPSQPSVRHTLPQNHECQKQLRAFMATLTEKDFTHGVTGKLDERAPCDQDPDYLYRNYLYTRMFQPFVGTKWGASPPAVQALPACFLLSNIERSDGVYLPPVWPETLMSFVQWDYPGNPFHNNRALKLRAFVGAVVQMTMFLNFAENNDSKVPPPIRPDWHGYHPVIWAAPYPGFKDALPPEVQRAYEACLKLAGERILSWPARDETCETNLLGPLGLVYISRAINDPEFSRKVEAYVRPMFTDARYIHPAGYWDERGGIETGFGGTANFYATWIALMTDWPFAKEALERTYRLRGHLILPEPDGTLTGPSHFNSRLGSPACKDQWTYALTGAAMITDEAAWIIKTPTAEQLAKAPATRAKQFNTQFTISQKVNPDFYTEEELKRIFGVPWTLRIWMTYRFPISVNPSYEFYRKGALAHRRELEEANSPLLKSPFLRGENFVRAFDKDFIVARRPGFAAIVHTGPVGVQTPDDAKAQFPGPMGLGGGQLSAFWTPGTGPVILSLRSGMTYNKSFDDLEQWQTWPIHAVSGTTGTQGRGEVFTSARIAKPEVVTEVKDDSATVTVSGPLVAMKVVKDPGAADPEKARSVMYDDQLTHKINYTRTIKITDKGVRVETTVNGGDNRWVDAIETIPVYLGAGQEQKVNANVKIEIQKGGKWTPLTEVMTGGVTAIRITRFGHAVLVTFDKDRYRRPSRVALGPADWTDRYLNNYATCRNIVMTLATDLDMSLGGPRAVNFTDNKERKFSYEITPVAEPAE